MSKFKVGDEVVCHKFQTTPGGIHWAPGMDEVAGKTGTIQRQVGSLKGWIVKVEGHRPWSFPEEALTLRPQPHKHAELIKAWADNPKLKLQWRHAFENWIDVTGSPCWTISLEYRIKPEPKPDRVRYATFGEYVNGHWKTSRELHDNVKATFDGETGKLKALELLA